MANKDLGFIKLHRKFLDWEWWGHPAETILFLYLLCSVSIKPIVIDGHKYPAGTTETTLRQLERDLGKFSLKNIRTALDHLEGTGEIVRKTTNKKTVITIVKWRKYQPSTSQSGKQTASERQANGKAHIKESKNVRNNIYSLSNRARTHEGEKDGLGEYENVFLSEEEISDLRELNKLEWMNYVFKLSEYMKQTGKEYSSHYAVIKKWMIEDLGA